MPELPEVQAHAERLTRRFAGNVLNAVEPLAFSTLKTYDPPPDAAVRSTLETVRRRGKLLILGFGEISHVVHLMQGGRLRSDDGAGRGGRGRGRGGVMRWRFAGGDALLLSEAGTERKAGVWCVRGDPLTQPPLDRLGPDADTVTPAELAPLLAEGSPRLHGFLRDQRMLAGLGRRLANEICHRARLSPFATTGRLGPDAAAILVEAIRSLVAEGLNHERALDDMSASKDRPAVVHNRAGEACQACGETVRAVVYRDYTVNYCPTCQTGGRVLADNVYSRLGVERDEQPARARGATKRR